MIVVLYWYLFKSYSYKMVWYYIGIEIDKLVEGNIEFKSRSLNKWRFRI